MNLLVKVREVEGIEKEKEKEIVTKDIEDFKMDEERAAYELWMVKLIENT